MHKMILDATIARVRQRASEGDCPITAPYSVEHLETALLTLADTDPLAAAPAHQPDRQGAGEGPQVCAVCDGFVPTWGARVCKCEYMAPAGTVAAPPPPADTAMREDINWKAEFETLSAARIQDREVIARIVDPEAFVPMEDIIGMRKAYAKADQILGATLSRRDAAEGRG